MPQWLRANLLLVGLVLISTAVLYLTHALATALGLFAEERRYLTAAVGVIVIVVNYFIARRMHRSFTRITLEKR
jgi:hypothetical protein